MLGLIVHGTRSTPRKRIFEPHQRRRATVFRSILRTSFVASAVVAAGFASGTLAQPSKSHPDFSSRNFGWVTMRGGVVAMPGSPAPVGQDPSRPLVANNTGQQPTFPYADLNNTNLTPFARDGLKKANDLSDSGFAMYSRGSRCWATGVPVALNSVVQPIFFIQTPKEVITIGQGDQTVRHIYMDVEHSANPKPSWYGESVGHYEGEWLVIDTIGQNTKTVLDAYRTPHSAKLHTVERWRMIEDGKTLEVVTTIDDPETYNAPWQGLRKYRRGQAQLGEQICAEGNFLLFDYGIPVANKPDF